MNYNPYAAPQAAPPQAPGAQLNGAPQPWEIGEVLTRAWETYKANWGVLTGAFVVTMICSLGPGLAINVAAGVSQGLSQRAPGSDPFSGVSIGTSVLNQLISAFFTIGMYRMGLAAARGQTPQFATLFSAGPRFLTYFGALILMGIAIGLGFVLLFVPGVILLCGLWATTFFVADTDLGVIDSLKASWEVSKGHRMALFLFGLVGILLQFAGALACCLGMLVTVPVFLVAQAIVFLRITGRGAAALPPAMGYGGAPPGYGGPPPGYGGPPPGYGGPPGGPQPGGGGYGGPPPGAPPGGYGPPGGGFPPR